MDFQQTRPNSSVADLTDNQEDDITFGNFEWELVKQNNLTTLPTCRNCHTATPFKHFMIVFGGKEGEGRKKFCNDIHILDLKRLIWLSSIKVLGNVPDVRMGHSAQTYFHRIIYYGGWNGYTVLDDVVTMTPSEVSENNIQIEWSVIKSENVAPKRQFHTANIQDNSMYIFGGGDGKMWLSDLFRFDFTNRLWSPIETSGQKPQGRLQHSSILFERKIFIFGGEPDRSHQLNDLYQLDLETSIWTRLAPRGTTPSPRVSASAVLMNNKIFFFGGYDGRQWRNDVFLFNILENQWEYIIADFLPKPRCRHSATPYKNQIVVFGGNDSEKSYNDVYVLRQCKSVCNIENPIKITESTLKHDYQKALFSPILSDIMFILDNNEVIHGHKIILATRCDYFRALFQNDSSERYAIQDTRTVVFRAMMQYIYTDEVNIDQNIVYELLTLADKYMLLRLKNMCEDYLVIYYNSINIIRLKTLALRMLQMQLILQIDLEQKNQSQMQCGSYLIIKTRYSTPRMLICYPRKSSLSFSNLLNEILLILYKMGCSCCKDKSESSKNDDSESDKQFEQETTDFRMKKGVTSINVLFQNLNQSSASVLISTCDTKGKSGQNSIFQKYPKLEQSIAGGQHHLGQITKIQNESITILLLVLPLYYGGDDQINTLKQAIRNVLDLIIAEQYESIGIEDIGVKRFGFPRQIVAKTIIEGFAFSLNRMPSLKQIDFMLNDVGSKVMFEQEIQARREKLKQTSATLQTEATDPSQLSMPLLDN